METGFTVEGARSKRAVEADAQPSQQPMRPDKLRRNPDNGQKKVRRQLQRKTAAEDRKGHSVTCPRCGATGLRTSVHPDGSRLDAYCDNCHWRGTKTRKTKESTVDFNQREAQILTAMASAPLAEQARLAVELGEVRRQRTAALEADREIDVSSAVIRDHLTPVAVHTMNTTATDWLDEVETESVGDTDAIVQAMRTEASLWFGRVGAEVKADSEEFGEQAQGMARYQASRFGMGASVAQRAFLDHVAHLQKAAESAVVVEPLPDSGSGPQNDQTAPWTTQETTGDSNTDASAQVEEHTSSLRAQAYAQHQTHSLISQSALRHLADDSPGKVDEDQSGNAESTITDYDTMGNDPEPFDEKMNGPLQPTGPFEVPSTRAPNVQGSLVAEGEYHYVHKHGDKWVITQKGTGKVLSTHDSESQAKASFRAMMQSKHGGSLRPISTIASEIDIESVPPAAQPYLAAMDGINTIADRFGQDDGRTLVAYFLANAPGITQEAELRQHLAADPQSGEAQSHDKEVAVGNPNDRPMWEWELPELPGETGRDADDVAGVHTPGQGVADYPQPKQSGLSVQAGFPLCAAGCNQTLSAADVLVNTTQGLAHAACMERTAEGTGEPMVQQGETLAPGDTGTLDSGRADPFVSEGAGGGDLRVTAKPWMVLQRGTGTSGNQRYDSKEEAEAAASSLNDTHGTNDFVAKEEYPDLIGARFSAVQHTAGNPHGVGTSQWFDWNDRVRAGEHPEGSGPHASDIPGGGIPLHGPLTEDQERWLHPPRHKRRMIDQEGKPYPRESSVEAGRMSERSGACADGDHDACKMSHGPGPDQCHCPYHGANTKPNKGRQHYSGACAAGDHGSCKMKHGNGPDECACPFGTHHTSSLQGEAAKQDRYRIVPSEQTGYGPGRHVVQKFYPDMKIWADVGDPRDTREEAEEHMRNQQKEARRSFVLATRHTAPGGGVHGPYEIEPKDKNASGPFKVVNAEGEVKGTFDSWDAAREQQKALYVNIPKAREQAEEAHKASLQVEGIRHYTHEELSKYPTQSQGQMDDLKLDTGTHRYWLSRGTKEDGEPYEHTVHVERHDDKTGGWTHHESYDGDNPSGKRSSLVTEAGVIGNSVSTHDLREGDTIVNHGMVLLLEDRKEYNGSGGGAAESDQPTVTFKGKCLNMEEFAPGGSKADSFIYHFLREDGGYWTVQGNKAATWWRIGKNSKLAAFRARVGAFVQRAALDTEASYYVHRKRGPRPDYGENDPPREGWVGPIRSPNQAEKERKAWEEAGHQAEVHPSSPEVRKRVRDWQKSVQERRKKGSLQTTADALEGPEWYQYMNPSGTGMGWFNPTDKAALEGSEDFEEGATWRPIPADELAGFNQWHAEQARAQASLSIDQSKLAAFRGRIAERL